MQRDAAFIKQLQAFSDPGNTIFGPESVFPVSRTFTGYAVAGYYTLKDPYRVKHGPFENLESDAYGRPYAEPVVRAKKNDGVWQPSRNKELLQSMGAAVF